jgi:hypothetical protein
MAVISATALQSELNFANTYKSSLNNVNAFSFVLTTPPSSELNFANTYKISLGNVSVFSILLQITIDPLIDQSAAQPSLGIRTSE